MVDRTLPTDLEGRMDYFLTKLARAHPENKQRLSSTELALQAMLLEADYRLDDDHEATLRALVERVEKELGRIKSARARLLAAKGDRAVVMSQPKSLRQTGTSEAGYFRGYGNLLRKGKKARTV